MPNFYIDNANISYRGDWYCHLGTDGTTEDLLAFGKKIGLSARWLQHRGTAREHFDVSSAKKSKAIFKGAKNVSSRDFVELVVRPKSGSMRAIAPEGVLPGGGK